MQNRSLFRLYTVNLYYLATTIISTGAGRGHILHPVWGQGAGHPGGHRHQGARHRGLLRGAGPRIIVIVVARLDELLQALLKTELRTASVVAVSEVVECLALDRE